MQVDQEWLVMNVDNCTMTKVNPIGALILEGFQQDKSIEDIARLIAAAYNVEVTVAVNDILSFLKELEGAELIFYGSM